MSGTPDSGIGEIFACGIQNLGKVCMWNPASWALESVVHLELSGILQTIEIRNPNSTDKESQKSIIPRNLGIHKSNTVLSYLTWSDTKVRKLLEASFFLISLPNILSGLGHVLDDH